MAPTISHPVGPMWEGEIAAIERRFGKHWNAMIVGSA